MDTALETNTSLVDFRDAAGMRQVVGALQWAGLTIPTHALDQIDLYLALVEEEVGIAALYGDEQATSVVVGRTVTSDMEFPEEYFRWQQRLLREQGHGNVAITSELREQLMATLQEDQRHSLQSWLSYLSIEDYPLWFRYATWKAITNLGPYSPEKQSFPKRSKNTVARFPELDREALAKTYDALSARKPEPRSFAKLYAKTLSDRLELAPIGDSLATTPLANS